MHTATSAGGRSASLLGAKPHIRQAQQGQGHVIAEGMFSDALLRQLAETWRRISGVRVVMALYCCRMRWVSAYWLALSMARVGRLPGSITSLLPFQ